MSEQINWFTHMEKRVGNLENDFRLLMMHFGLNIEEDSNVRFIDQRIRHDLAGVSH